MATLAEHRPVSPPGDLERHEFLVKPAMRVLARAADRARNQDNLALMHALAAAAVVGPSARYDRDRDDDQDDGRNLEIENSDREVAV